MTKFAMRKCPFLGLVRFIIGTTISIIKSAVAIAIFATWYVVTLFGILIAVITSVFRR